MTDISKEAVERLARTADLFAKAMKAWQHQTQKHNEDVRDTLRALSARVEELEGDREQLALAIMGGEDAPGFAAAQLTGTLVQIIADNRKDAIAWAEYDAKEAEKRGRLQGLDEATQAAAKEAERYASHYPEGTDGRNTFTILADSLRGHILEDLKEQSDD